MKIRCFNVIMAICLFLLFVFSVYSDQPINEEKNMDNTKFPSRQVLENIPRVGFNIHLCPFPGSLYAYLKYVGEPGDYDYIMGTTGAAFRRLWNRDDGGNIDLSYLGETPFKSVLDALGFEYQTIPAEKQAMIKSIMESINKGRPAISFGILGPPEAGIIAGYDKDGEILYGWSYFEGKGDKYYEKRDWFETMDKNAGKGLIIIGDKKQRPSDREILITSLKWAIDLERTANRPELPKHIDGLAAYEAWASGLEIDADYPKDNPKIMETRIMIHGDQCTMLEERHSAANYLRQMAKIAPEVADQLTSAAKLYDESADQVNYLWKWGDYKDPKVSEVLSDHETRFELAKYIREVGKKETQAVEYLEKALALLTKETEPKIADREAFTVMGVLAQGDPGSMNFGEIWNQFMSRYTQVSPFSENKAYYGVYFGSHLFPKETRIVDMIAGMAVKNVKNTPDGLVAREVPAMRCAVFECTMKTVSQTWNYIYEKWFPESQYQHDDKPDIEYFPPDTSTPDSPVYIYIPIKAKL